MTTERVSTEKIILYVIAAIGIVALVAVAPGMARVFKTFNIRKKFPSPAAVENALSRMKRKGYVIFVEQNGKRFMRLTPAGERRLAQYRARDMRRPRRAKRWDGKWRIVTFDIPERFRRVRDQVRRELREAGFVQLHQSVWVSPYDAEEFVALLKADRHIGRGVLYVVAERVEYDKPLKARFNIT